ncbi:MAG: hypothetical protein R2754_00045 [Microthrixaceae bacterium]
MEVVYGNHTSGTTLVTGAALPHAAWVFHIIDGGRAIRLHIPDGQINEIGDVVYANGEEVGHSHHHRLPGRLRRQGVHLQRGRGLMAFDLGAA